MTDAEIEQLLLTPEQVRAVHTSREKNPPYPIRHSTGSRHIIFIGTRHTNNPADPQFALIQEEWQRFAGVYSGSEPIALVEGGQWPLEATAEQAIRISGESGLLTYLARRDGIELTSPEPRREEDVRHLVELFGQDKTILYYVLRQIPQWHRSHGQPPLRVYLEAMLRRYQQLFGWDEHLSVARAELLHEKIIGKPLDMDRERDIAMRIDPYLEVSPLNEVSRACGQYRDLVIARAIWRLWSEGRPIFAAYGCGHAHKLEPFIRHLS